MDSGGMDAGIGAGGALGNVWLCILVVGGRQQRLCFPDDNFMQGPGLFGEGESFLGEAANKVDDMGMVTLRVEICVF